MLTLVESGFKFWMGMFNFYLPQPKEIPKKVTPANARWKVTKKAVKTCVFFSNKPTKEEAEKEAWRHFNIYSEKVKSSHEVPFFEVVENPNKSIDDDGYDVVTGLKVE